jgi:glycosyltransferase involved in cell wall biosynthesis
VTVPTVTIVIPCYNAGRFLDNALSSLRKQIFRDFETVIVDDGSTDASTLAMLKAFETDGVPDLSVRVLRQSNLGLAAARNTGFRAARSDIVLPLDCDDALTPDFLSESVPRLTAAPPDVAFVFTHMQVEGALKGVLPRHFNRFDQLFLNRLPYCLLLRKSAWATVGGYDDSMRDGYEDWEFNIRLTLAGFQGIEINRPLFIYFVSPDGMLMSRSARLHGRMWRRILLRHSDVYTLSRLRELHAAWRDADGRFGLASGLLTVWAGKWLPERAVNAMFFRSLRAVHWLRVRFGILNAPISATDKKGM